MEYGREIYLENVDPNTDEYVSLFDCYPCFLKFSLLLTYLHIPSCVQPGEPLPKHIDEGDWDGLAIDSQGGTEVDPPLSEREDTTPERTALEWVSMVVKPLIGYGFASFTDEYEYMLIEWSSIYLCIRMYFNPFLWPDMIVTSIIQKLCE